MMISLGIAPFIRLTPFKTISFFYIRYTSLCLSFWENKKLDVSWKYMLISWSEKDECPFSWSPSETTQYVHDCNICNLNNVILLACCHSMRDICSSKKSPAYRCVRFSCGVSEHWWWSACNLYWCQPLYWKIADELQLHFWLSFRLNTTLKCTQKELYGAMQISSL